MFRSILPGGDLNAALVPHGFMIGAGLMALVQVGIVIIRRDANWRRQRGGRRSGGVGGTLGWGFAGYLCIAIGIAVAGGLTSDLSIPC